MRTIVVAILASCIAATSMVAQTPASGQLASAWKCAAPSPAHMLPVPDQPNHVYSVASTQCTATKGEIGGVAEKTGVTTEIMEVMGTTAKGRGTFVETLANGDKITVSYEFTGTMKDKQFQSGSNKWMVESGTGKFKGLKGQGTCKATGNPDGSAMFDCMGSYTLAQ